METKENEYIENKEVEINGVVAEPNDYKADEIKRVSFMIGEQKITWKPVVKKEEYRDGIKIPMHQPMKFDELPEIVKSIAKIAQSKGSCRVRVCFNRMVVEKDGEDQVYRFLNKFVSPQDKWVIVEEKETEI